ncbi:DNA repair protein RecO [Streptomyces sp. NPDC005921]
MSLFRDDGIVLRTQKLGEADRIITLLTRGHGRVRAVARGVRRTKSKFGARLEPFSHVDVQFFARGSKLILMQLLVRHIYDKAATSAHVRYALTEIEDECRHSKMFARLIERGDAPWYPVSRAHQNLGRLFKTISTTPGSFTATLLGEEVLDWMQRLTFPDERVQPLIRGVTRIHVVEEARHVRYAREELRRQMLTAPRWSQEFTRVTSGEFARVFSVAFVNPEVYTNVGLDRREAVAQVQVSGHRREVMQTGAKRLTDFLDDIGVLRGVGRRLWKSSGLLG